MLLIGLIVIAVVALALGFIFSATWLFWVSLISSAVAAILLLGFTLRQRSTGQSSAEPDAESGSAGTTSDDVQSDADGDSAVLKKSRDDKPSRAEKKAEKARAKETAEQPPAAAAASGSGSSTTGDVDVIVVDGAPEYHLAGCSSLGDSETVDIPLSQALEDGFTACTVCTPPTSVPTPDEPASGAATSDSATSGSKTSDSTTSGSTMSGSDAPLTEVWVVDGSPSFHVAGCTELRDGDAEQIPAEQALEDGFVACTVCAPMVAASTTPGTSVTPDAPAAASAGDAEVWVVDGQPEYHVQGCSELEGFESESVPHEQAVEDGFQPCVVCDPEHSGVGVPSGGADDSGSADEPAEGEVLVVDGRPDYHSAGCAEIAGQDTVAIPHEQAVEDGFTACTVCTPDGASTSTPDTAPVAEAAAAADTTSDDTASGDTTADDTATDADTSEDEHPAAEAAAAGSHAAEDAAEVWVVDGFPDYHRSGCRLLLNQHGVAIPHDQAVEDGFSECDVCSPEAASAPAQAFVPPSAGSPDVWVVDGQPTFHRPECREILGLDSEPIPHDQAVEDGFTACEICTPDAESAPAGATAPVGDPGSAHAPEAADEAVSAGDAGTTTDTAAAGEVWVVDGFPDYHRAGCSVIAGNDAEAIPHDQAVEDGFTECTVCQPEAAEAPSAPVESAPVGSAPAEPAAAQSEPAAARSEPEPEPAAAQPVPEPVAAEPEPVAATKAPATKSAAKKSAPAEPGAGVTAGRDVWVIDGRPRFHTHDCLIIKGQPATKMPLDEATSDGFKACSLCRAG